MFLSILTLLGQRLFLRPKSKLLFLHQNIKKSITTPMQTIGAVVGSICGVESLKSQNSIPFRTSKESVSSWDVMDKPSDLPPSRLEA